jgi:hypothetical protein
VLWYAQGYRGAPADGPGVAGNIRGDLFVPKAERHAHSLSQCRVYRLITVRRSPPASVQDRMGCHSFSHSACLSRESGLGVASSNARTEAQIACTRTLAYSHTTATSISIGRAGYGRSAVRSGAASPAPLHTGRLAGRRGEGCCLADDPHSQGVLSEVLDHVASAYDAWACVFELPPGVVRDLRCHGQRFHCVGCHTLRPQQ